MQSLQKIKDFGLLVGQANKLGMAEVKISREDAVSLLAEINILLATVTELSTAKTDTTATISSISGGGFN